MEEAQLRHEISHMIRMPQQIGPGSASSTGCRRLRGYALVRTGTSTGATTSPYPRGNRQMDHPSSDSLELTMRN